MANNSLRVLKVTTIYYPHTSSLYSIHPRSSQQSSHHKLKYITAGSRAVAEETTRCGTFITPYYQPYYSTLTHPLKATAEVGAFSYIYFVYTISYYTLCEALILLAWLLVRCKSTHVHTSPSSSSQYRGRIGQKVEKSASKVKRVRRL